MAKVVDPRKLPDASMCPPGLKPPVQDFTTLDDGDPAEVDAFLQMIRAL
jgi:hypothetical protein